MGSHFLELLKGITVFLLAGQLVLRFLPEGGYEKYARIIIGVMVLSRLALPLLSLGGFDAGRVFADALEGYEKEFADIERQVEQAGLEEGGFVQEGLLTSLSERLEDFCAKEGIRLVSAAFDEDGMLHMTLDTLPQTDGKSGSGQPGEGDAGAAGGEGEGKKAGRIEVGPVLAGEGWSGNGEEGAGASKDTARDQKRLTGLREALAGRLEMEPEKLEVKWDE